MNWPLCFDIFFQIHCLFALISKLRQKFFVLLVLTHLYQNCAKIFLSNRWREMNFEVESDCFKIAKLTVIKSKVKLDLKILKQLLLNLYNIPQCTFANNWTLTVKIYQRLWYNFLSKWFWRTHIKIAPKIFCQIDGGKWILK